MSKPTQKVLKQFFKLISLDLAPKVKAELGRGLDPNVQFDATGYGAVSALTYAIDGKRAASVRVLLDAGADVKAAGSRGTTALHEVSDAKTAKELISRGADVNAAAADGRTPLHTAAEKGDVELVTLLLEKGARVEANTKEGATPYASTSSVAVREALKKHGAKGFGKGGGHPLSPKSKAGNPADVQAEALGVDREGRVWFASPDQAIFVLEKDKLTRYDFEESFSVCDIAPGPKGIVYFGTNWGLLRFQNGKFTLYTSSDSELFDSHIIYMRTSPDGRAYMICYEDEADEKHISIFDGETFSLLAPRRDLPKEFPIECVAFDPRGSLILGGGEGLATQEGGKWRVNKKIHDVNVYDVAVDKDALWIGGGSGVVELRDGKLKRYETEELAKCVCKDGNVLWIGLSFGGLGRLEDGKLTVMKEESSALPNDDVQQLVRGADGRVWVRAGDGEVPVFVERGVLRRLDGKTPKKEGEPPKRKRKLVAFPGTPLVAANVIPKAVRDAIEKTKLEVVTAAQLLSIVRPAIAFDLAPAKNIAIGASKLGGRPDLPDSIAWPRFEHDEDRALPFLLQINLAETAKMDIEQLLPKRGMLYFFSDTSPDELDDVRVLYAKPAKLARREFPEDLVDRKNEVDFVAQLPEYALKLFSVFTLPSVTLLGRRAELIEEDQSALFDLKEKVIKLASRGLDEECSRLLGWPDSVQDEVVDGEDQISLLQLNGMKLAPKGVHRVFEHWCSDGLIHVVIGRKDLDEQRFENAAASMAYT